MKLLKDIFHGFAFGVANIIPGVSGGTLALVLGFYERLLGFLNRLNPTTLRELLALKFHWLARPLDRERAKAFFGRLAEDDWGFMARLLLGALVAIVGLARLMDYLLNEQFSLTYAFFFGLILLSVHVPWVLIRSKGAAVWVNLILGIAITVGIAAAVNPYEKAKQKSDLYQVQTEQAVLETSVNGEVAPALGTFSFSGKYSEVEYLIIFVSGLIAVSAMVLPGISGSLIMILLGQYFIIIRALSSLIEDWLLDDMLFLVCCAFGMVVGLLLTARIVDIALRKAYDSTMAFLTGLIIGSFWALWPFKQIYVLDEYQRDGSVLEARNIASNINQFPTQLSSWLPVLGMMALGVAVMWAVMKMGEREKA
jgi:putative membrane protein